MAKKVAERIGRRVRKVRVARRMTQDRLAKRAGVRRETIYRLEGGRMASPEVLARVCDALGIDRDKFKFNIRITDGFSSHPELTLLRDRRRERGLSLAPCAAAAGVSEATLSRFERGMESSRALAKFNAEGRAVGLINEGLAKILGFDDIGALDYYWRTGKLREPSETLGGGR